MIPRSADRFFWELIAEGNHPRALDHRMDDGRQWKLAEWRCRTGINSTMISDRP